MERAQQGIALRSRLWSKARELLVLTRAAPDIASVSLRSPSAWVAGFRYSSRFSAQRSDPEESQPAAATWLESYVAQHKTGPGLWKWRHYLPVYERHLAQFRNRPVRVMEIGIYSGGSLQMWRSYFGSGAQIYGVDIEPVCRSYEDSNTRVFIGDQADPEFWRRVLAEVGEIDIVIDDGGHQPTQQVRTLEAVLPHLSPGGVYICEDVHGRFNVFSAYVAGLIASMNGARWCQSEGSLALECEPSEFQRLVDSIHIYPYLVVIEMRQRTVDLLTAPKMGDQWQPFLDVAIPE